jgi:hypothetical protein
MAKKKKSTKQAYKVGQIVAIRLPDRRFAYAKVFNDFDLGVYDFLSAEIEPMARVVRHKFSFFNAVTDRAIKSGTFLVIGEQPFPDEESAWAPPMASGIFPDDPGVGVLHIDHKGISRRAATPKEAAGMDVRSFSQRPELFVGQIVDRLVKGNHDNYRV